MLDSLTLGALGVLSPQQILAVAVFVSLAVAGAMALSARGIANDALRDSEESEARMPDNVILRLRELRGKGGHPASGRYCPWCGVDLDNGTPHVPDVKHAGDASYCHICQAGPGSPCDAGLHS